MFESASDPPLSAVVEKAAGLIKSAQGRQRFWRPTRSLLVCLLLFVLISLQLLRSSGAAASLSSGVEVGEDEKGVDWSQFAYSLYATSDAYLCNAVMIIESLHRLGSKAERLLLYNEQWVLTPNTYEGRLLVRAMDKYGATLKPVKVVRHGDSFTWQDSFTKLLAFNQTQYKRVLSLDSDATVMQSMDELFLMDSATVAAPRAYWLPENTLSSQIMLIEPNTTQYNRISQDELGLKENDFDMEVLNHLWKNDSLSIPWRPYDIITGEFKNSGTHSSYLGNAREEWNATAILQEAKFVHFSDWPVPKPWIPNSQSEVEKIVEGCADNPKYDCEGVQVWHGIYKNYWKRREAVCDDLRTLRRARKAH